MEKLFPILFQGVTVSRTGKRNAEGRMSKYMKGFVGSTVFYCQLHIVSRIGEESITWEGLLTPENPTVCRIQYGTK